MKKIEFVGSVSVESLFDVYNLNGWEDGFVGSGVYRIKVGYRDWETDRKSTRLNSSHRL